MKFLFVLVVALACVMLSAAMVFIDNGIVQDAMVCALGSLVGFLLAYQIQARTTPVADI